MTNSRRKGAAGEREAVHLLRSLGLQAERVDSRAASAGHATGSDVLFGETDPIWPLEIKRGRTYRVPAWARPYIEMGRPVLSREDGGSWTLTLPEYLVGPALRAVATELARLAGLEE